MARVIWSPQALDAVDAIASYLERNSQTYAKLQVQRFFDKVKLLETHPLLGRIVPEVNQLHFRELITEGTYRIIYRVVDSETLGIITLHHTSRPLRTPTLGIDIEPMQLLVKETFSLTKEPLFFVAGSSTSAKVSTGMIIKHKTHQFIIHDIREMRVNWAEYLTVIALGIKCQNEAEKALLKEIFEKGEIIEIF